MSCARCSPRLLQPRASSAGRWFRALSRTSAKFCDAAHCVGVGSGTDALRFALLAAGVGSGDAVVTVPNTFIATTEAISQAGARPVFVDIDEATYNLDPEKLREYLETQCDRDPKQVLSSTGRPAAGSWPSFRSTCTARWPTWTRFWRLPKKYDLIVIEDACQAHGAEYFSRKQNLWCKAGSMGLAAAFSFYPGKNLGACGEAGAVTTNDAELAQKIRMLRDHGQAQKYYHDMEGYNGRLDSIQAGFLRVKLAHLPKWTEGRRQAAARYRELFAAADAIDRLAIRAGMEQGGLPPVRSKDARSGFANKEPGRSRHRHRNPLSYPATSSEGLRDTGLFEGRFPDCGGGRS